MAGVWMSSAFLLGLQLHWGALIVRGLLKLVSSPGSKTKTTVERSSVDTAEPTSSAQPLKASGDARKVTNGIHKQKAT